MNKYNKYNKYGYDKDKNDPRDFKINFNDEKSATTKLKLQKNPAPKAIPTSFNLGQIIKIPDILSNINQGQLGSCTANAIAYAYTLLEINQKNKQVLFPSRLFIYYNERLMEGTINQDAGAHLRSGFKSLVKYGTCSESMWVYNPLKFKTAPSSNLYSEATKSKALQYFSLDFSSSPTINDRVNNIKLALYNGNPIVFGFLVYSSFETTKVAKTGIVSLPNTATEKFLGGHAVCAIGYDDSKNAILVKNSWGRSWGINGNFYMPYNYIGDKNLAFDFWIIKQVTNPNNIKGYNSTFINPI